MGSKRNYQAAYRLEVVQMTRQPGRTVVGVAKELGIPWKTVAGWVSRWNKGGTAAFVESSEGHQRKPEKKLSATVEQLEAENQRLRRENEALRQEREVLKKPRSSSPESRNEVSVH